MKDINRNVRLLVLQCQKCGKLIDEFPRSKYCSDGSDKDNSHDWERIDVTLSPAPVLGKAVKAADLKFGERVLVLHGENIWQGYKGATQVRWIEATDNSADCLSRNLDYPQYTKFYRDPRPLPSQPRETLEEKIADILRYYKGFGSDGVAIQSVASEIAALLEENK